MLIRPHFTYVVFCLLWSSQRHGNISTWSTHPAPKTHHRDHITATIPIGATHTSIHVHNHSLCLLLCLTYSSQQILLSPVSRGPLDVIAFNDIHRLWIIVFMTSAEPLRHHKQVCTGPMCVEFKGMWHAKLEHEPQPTISPVPTSTSILITA